jgi:hypothetical protein
VDVGVLAKTTRPWGSANISSIFSSRNSAGSDGPMTISPSLHSPVLSPVKEKLTLVSSRGEQSRDLSAYLVSWRRLYSQHHSDPAVVLGHHLQCFHGRIVDQSCVIHSLKIKPPIPLFLSRASLSLLGGFLKVPWKYSGLGPMLLF